MSIGEFVLERDPLGRLLGRREEAGGVITADIEWVQSSRVVSNRSRKASRLAGNRRKPRYYGGFPMGDIFGEESMSGESRDRGGPSRASTLLSRLGRRRFCLEGASSSD